jgi:hypothetical protein
MRIQEAGAPPRFSNEFLKNSLGFPSSNDRGIITVLKQLGFLSSDGAPTQRYNEFRSGTVGGRALADGLREGWSAVFLADQRAHEKTSAQLVEIFKTVTGKSGAVAQKMASTFKALVDAADWSATPPTPSVKETEVADEKSKPVVIAADERRVDRITSGISLNHDIHVHLPPTSDVAVYKAIFRALREELID